MSRIFRGDGVVPDSVRIGGLQDGLAESILSVWKGFDMPFDPDFDGAFWNSVPVVPCVEEVCNLPDGDALVYRGWQTDAYGPLTAVSELWYVADDGTWVRVRDVRSEAFRSITLILREAQRWPRGSTSGTPPMTAR